MSPNFAPTPEEQQAASNAYIKTLLEQREVAMNRCAELSAQVAILDSRVESMDKMNGELVKKIAELTAQVSNTPVAVEHQPV